LLLFELGRIMRAEEDYMNRIPVNLQAGEACAAAEYTVDVINEAIVSLEDAF
jgi:hypothetical protein